MTSEPTTDRLAEIRAALASVPAPPWRWIGLRGAGGPQLVTDHSGRQYLLRATQPVDRHGEELLEPTNDSVIYGDIEFRDQREGEQYSLMRPGNKLGVGRTHYDPDSLVDVDNPVARWMRDAPQYVADLLAELEHRLPLGDVDHFLRRERDEYEPRGECWNTVNDVLDALRLHVVTGTPLTEPRPQGGPEAHGVGPEPLTEAEELRAQLDAVWALVEPWRSADFVSASLRDLVYGLLSIRDRAAIAAESSSLSGEQA